MTSRDEADLHPELRVRWHQCIAEWMKRYPRGPVAFLTCTYRDWADQDRCFDEHKSRARGGESIHNYKPSCALDFAFRLEDGSLSWDNHLFLEMGEIGEKYGLEWGGRWKRIHDGPHLQAPGYTWRDIRAGRQPVWGELKE